MADTSADYSALKRRIGNHKGRGRKMGSCLIPSSILSAIFIISAFPVRIGAGAVLGPLVRGWQKLSIDPRCPRAVHGTHLRITREIYDEQVFARQLNDEQI